MHSESIVVNCNKFEETGMKYVERKREICKTIWAKKRMQIEYEFTFLKVASTLGNMHEEK